MTPRSWLTPRRRHSEAGAGYQRPPPAAVASARGLIPRAGTPHGTARGRGTRCFLAGPRHAQDGG
jgi:hypothetical protein